MSIIEQLLLNNGEQESDCGIDPQKLQHIYDDVQKVYTSDSRPWVIGYSGGKDSTTALQIIWIALSRLPRKMLTKAVYIISSDTLVESPVVITYLHELNKKINEAAQQLNLPFQAHIVYPELCETFWVNMIGKGYPAPYRRFRWCTDRLKIKPANRFILEKVALYGEVVLVLGVRRSESATRAQVMNLHRRIGDRLSRHSTLRNAWVYTPIEDFSLNEVWDYLLSVPSPWGTQNSDLMTMYRNAQAGECPLVVDTTTPSCGNSRFGCWTCTVVDRDKTMESLIDNGEEWLEPLLELRNWLSLSQDPETKFQYRMPKRRDGRVHYWGDNREKIIWGPYKLEMRKEILKRLLQTQEKVRTEGPNPSMTLISIEELHEIRRIWRSEEGDWEDSLPKIHRETTGRDIECSHEDLSQPGLLEFKLLEECANEENISPQLLRELIDMEIQLQGMSRRSTVFSKIESIFKKDWRPDEEILEQLRLSSAESDEEALDEIE